jgi:hypothetical protein
MSNIIDANTIQTSLTEAADAITAGNMESVPSSIAPIILKSNVITPAPPPINDKLEEISVSMTPMKRCDTTNYNLTSTMRKIRKQRQLHRLSAQYYERLNAVITIPAIAISGAATVYSFAYPSEAPSEQVFTNKIIAGCLSAVNTILFSVSGFLKLESKSESHFIAAEEYDNLLTMINFELKFPNEHIQDFANKVEKKILEIKKSCRYFPPNHIIEKYCRENPVQAGDDNSMSI